MVLHHGVLCGAANGPSTAGRGAAAGQGLTLLQRLAAGGARGAWGLQHSPPLVPPPTSGSFHPPLLRVSTSFCLPFQFQDSVGFTIPQIELKNPPSNAGDTGSIPGQGTTMPHATGQLNPRTTTIKAQVGKKKKKDCGLWNLTTSSLNPDPTLHYCVPTLCTPPLQEVK